MRFDEIKEKLEAVKSSSQYVRVSAGHPLELYLGKNEKGFPTLRYNGNFTPIKVIGTNLIEIKQVKTSCYNSILFSFTAEDNFSLFYHFCEDMITETENYKGDDGYKEVVNRYNQWKKMFTGNNKILTENEVLGLIGELLFLKDYQNKKNNYLLILLFQMVLSFLLILYIHKNNLLVILSMMLFQMKLI